MADEANQDAEEAAFQARLSLAHRRSERRRDVIVGSTAILVGTAATGFANRMTSPSTTYAIAAAIVVIGVIVIVRGMLR